MICLEDADPHTRNRRRIYTIQEEIDVYNVRRR